MSQRVERALAVPTRVLIVEDDERYAWLLSDLLVSSLPDIAITRVTTLGKAIQSIDRGDVDLILLDLGLSDAEGSQALDRLRSCIPEVPVIVLTARSDEPLALAALKAGVQDYLVKDTVDQRLLLRSIRYALERHRRLRDLASVTTELHRANAALERLTQIDPLTELLNRRGLQQVLSREVQRMDRDGVESLILIVDVDDFKRVNDSFGHAVGDVALKEIANRLRASVRAVDFVCRIGGDEFLLLLPNADRVEAIRIAERARLSIATTLIEHSSGTFGLTASVAAMLLQADTPSIEELLAKAHQLLQRSKNEGKNRVVYERGQFDDTGKRQQAQSDLCSNLVHGLNLFTVKQPIMRLSDESTVGYELLSRYSNGVLEMPDNFFPVCAERNILTLVDHQCLRSALRTSAAIAGRMRFHVNLFPSTLINIPIDHLLASFPQPIPADTYCVEISEQQILGDPSYLLEPVQALRNAGLLIAIDDVGFGNSSLESLMLLEPHVLKIDKRCVVGLAGDPARVNLLRRYMTLSRTLGSELVAEGIESRSDLSTLQELDVQWGQGFLWGTPA